MNVPDCDLRHKLQERSPASVDCSNLSEDDFFNSVLVPEMRVSKNIFAIAPWIDDRQEICNGGGRIEFKRNTCPQGRYVRLRLIVSRPAGRDFVLSTESEASIDEWLREWGDLHKFHLSTGESRSEQWLVVSLLVDPLALGMIGRDSGGSPFVIGTRFRVSEIIAAGKSFGWSPEVARSELFEQLSPQQIYSVWAYGWEHQAEVTTELAARQALIRHFQNRSATPVAGS